LEDADLVLQVLDGFSGLHEQCLTQISEGENMPALKGTKSHENLKHAFAGESQANRRYLYFARRADIEGYPDIGGLFRDTAEAETGHAFGHLDYLKEVGDPATGIPIGNTEANLKSAIEGETYEYTEMYPGMAKSAREEGFKELAEWFETLAKAEKSHAGRFTKGLSLVAGKEPSDAIA
jgi:rubrerythrin